MMEPEDSKMKALKTLSVTETAALLRKHFHVDAEVVGSGFRNVDGATLAFYEEADLEAAGISNRPLRRRICQEIEDMKKNGVPVTKRLSLGGSAKLLLRRNSLNKISPRESISRVSSFEDKAKRRWSFGTKAEKDSARGSRRNARLDGELRRYAKKLPHGILSIEALPDENDTLIFAATLTDEDAAPKMILKVSPKYPFEGPIVEYKQFTVHYILGNKASHLNPPDLTEASHDTSLNIIKSPWTPAQSLSDAIILAKDLVRSKLSP